MPSRKDSQKVIETKEKLKKAFFAIYKNKKIESINVKEITDKAGFNRGTFYLYYKSIYDLLKQVETEIVEDFQKNMPELMILFFTQDFSNEEMKRKISALFNKHEKYLRVLHGQNGDPLFQYKSKAMIKKAYIKTLGMEDRDDLPIPYEYVLEYIVQANIAIVTYWFERRKNDVQFEDLLSMIHNIMNKGAINVLKNYIYK